MLLEKDGIRWDITDEIILSAFLKSGWVKVEDTESEQAGEPEVKKAGRKPKGE